MQNIVIDKPYKFIPPHRGNWWPNFIQRFDLIGIYLRRSHGIISYECRHQDRLKASLDLGHGIMLTPNHSRPADPIVLGFLAREVGCHVYAMASWHLFMQDRFTAWAIRKMGGFSVYREGIDRKAINTAIEALQNAERPLVIFPEGSVTRTNDHLHALLDGIAFIARTAAKRRKKLAADKKVVIHPVAIKYLFDGDLQETLDPVLSEIEHRLSWRPQKDLSLIKRIIKVGFALLTLKEVEYYGRPQEGALGERLDNLIDRLMCPLEERWLGQAEHGPVVPRVKALRMAILPEMVQGTISNEEREQRWHDLADIYLAQQLSCYLPDYIDQPSEMRLMETVERYEEDLTDVVRVHGNLRVILDVGEAIEVSPQRDRKAKIDPLMLRIENDLQTMLDSLAHESPVYQEEPDE